MKGVVLLENVDPDVLDGNIWTGGKKRRKYININELLGVNVSTYGSGNISNVTMNGEPKTNTWYRKNLEHAKLYVDMNTNQLVADNLGEDLDELVIDKYNYWNDVRKEEINKLKSWLEKVEKVPTNIKGKIDLDTGKQLTPVQIGKYYKASEMSSYLIRKDVEKILEKGFPDSQTSTKITVEEEGGGNEKGSTMIDTGEKWDLEDLKKQIFDFWTKEVPQASVKQFPPKKIYNIGSYVPSPSISKENVFPHPRDRDFRTYVIGLEMYNKQTGQEVSIRYYFIAQGHFLTHDKTVAEVWAEIDAGRNFLIDKQHRILMVEIVKKNLGLDVSENEANKEKMIEIKKQILDFWKKSVPQASIEQFPPNRIYNIDSNVPSPSISKKDVFTPPEDHYFRTYVVGLEMYNKQTGQKVSIRYYFIAQGYFYTHDGEVANQWAEIDHENFLTSPDDLPIMVELVKKNLGLDQKEEKSSISSKDKIIIEALPQRFDQLEGKKKSKSLSLRERFALFKVAINKVFQPTIDMLADEITQKYNESEKMTDLEIKERFKSEAPIVMQWKRSEDKRKLAQRWAKENVIGDIQKTLSKLILLDDAEIIFYDPQTRNLHLQGSIFGSKVLLKQQVIEKYTEKLKAFFQFPARIYLDGKFIKESAYHRWFKQKSKETFEGVTDILEENATENKYPIGTVFYKEGKYKASDAKKGIWPISVYVVVGIKKDHLVVQRVRVNVDTVQGRYPFAHHFQAFYEITDEKIGDTKEWPVKATPTSSKLQEKGVEIAKGRYIQSSPFMKVWNGFKPTIHIPDEGKLLKIDDDNWEFVFDGETYKVKRGSYQDWTLKDSIDRLINQLYSNIVRNINLDPSSFLKKYRSSQK